MDNSSSILSTPYNFIQAAEKPIAYTYLVTMIFIVLMNVMNVCVLCRPSLRSSPCTYYFLASGLPVPVFIIVTPINQILINIRGFYLSNSTITCRLVQFLIFINSLLYTSMLVCATIDRFLSSSASIRLRQLSNVRVARLVIIVVWILALIYLSPFIFLNYYDPNSGSNNKCVQYSTTLISIYLISRVILYYVMIPLVLIIFGSLTIRSIRSQRKRIVPANQISSRRRTESQLGLMLVIQVAVYLIFFMPSGIIYIIVTFVPSMKTSYYSTIRSVTGAWQEGGYFISFFFYILAGKIYREEMKKLFKWDQIRDKVMQ